MKKIFIVLALLFSFIILSSCDSENNNLNSNKEPEPYSFFTETYAADDYNYEFVYKFKNDFNYNILEEKYGINDATTYYLIDNSEDYYIITNELLGIGNEPANDPNTYVWLYIKRIAAQSNLIKIDYKFGGEVFFSSYPFEHDAGDTAEFVCIDIIRIEHNHLEAFQMDENGQIIIEHYSKVN